MASYANSSSSNESIIESKKLDSKQNEHFSIFFKLNCCFWLSFSNFYFSEGLSRHLLRERGERNQLIVFDNKADYDFYQASLYLLEFTCLIIPSITYFVWSRVSVFCKNRFL